jgi:protein ImuB
MIAPSDQTGRWIGSLPTNALRLPEEMISALSALGMDVIEEIESKPRASLALRFGERLTRRLDQAYGRIAEPITPLEAPELIQARRGFPEPIGAPETLARQTQKLTQELCTALETHNLGARIVDLLFHRVDNRIEAVRVAVAKPQRDVKRLTRLLCDKLETVDPGFGVEAMVLSAPQVEPLSWKPAPGDLGQRAQPDVSELVDTLANRLGPGRLYRMAPAQSDVPERSAQKVHPSAPPCGASWPAEWPRPARLLTPPERIETLALLPDQPPASFTWRGVRRRIKRADGPERVFAEWWRADEELHAVRDYFQIEDEAGERFWVFRQGDGEQPATGDLSWYLHGVFG